MPNWPNVSLYYRKRDIQAGFTLVSIRFKDAEEQGQIPKSLVNRQVATNSPHHLATPFIEQTYVYQGGWGCVGGLWETGIDIYTLLIVCTKQITDENTWIAQGTLFNALCWPEQEGSPKGRECMYVKG